MFKVVALGLRGGHWCGCSEALALGCGSREGRQPLSVLEG